MKKILFILSILLASFTVAMSQNVEQKAGNTKKHERRERRELRIQKRSMSHITVIHHRKLTRTFNRRHNLIK